MGTRTRLTVRRWPSRLLLYATSAVVLAVVVAACTSDQQPRPSAARQTQQAASTGAATSPLNASTAAAPASPADASLQLQALLGQHTVLAADMMRGRLRNDPDLAQAANAALGKNTDAIGAIVAALFGEPAKTRFASLWAAHVTALFNYARGLADNDDAVRAQARATIASFENELAAFFSTASKGRLPRDAAQAAVKMHVDHLLQQADAYAAKDYARADRIYREAYSHAFALGKALASTLLPPEAAGVLNTPNWRLRSELGRLLGEHVVLVVAAMRAGVTNAADFATAAASVNGNTRDLAGAIDSLFGPAAARQFQSLWADHVDAIIDYSAALASSDAGRSAGALKQLDAFEGQLATFLATATTKRLAAPTLAKALQSHDNMLLEQVDAFVKKDYQKAHDLAYTTYQEMFGLSRALSTAFGVTVASRVPKGGVQTGRGGQAAVVERRGRGR